MRQPFFVLLAVTTLALGCGDDGAPLAQFDDAATVDGARPDSERADAGGPASALHDGAAGPQARDAAQSDASDQDSARATSALPYARTVQSFRAGAGAGFGQQSFPDVVTGPPRGMGTEAGSLDVLSLGVGGEIVLDLGARAIVDGPGPDFIVFENPFWPGGASASVFAELGEVSVSDDLTVWQTFPCARAGTGDGRFAGCAGWTPTFLYDPFAVLPLDPMRTGGDAFDLAALALGRARYVRIRDLSTSGEGETAGFDLDAVGVIHPGP